MAKLTARERAKLPDRAFAYIDARGRRRLPIHDEAHVRNALARFGRVSFENDAARDVARKRLLRAAKKHGIVPVGFIDGQVRTERLQAEIRARSTDPGSLPTGRVTLLLTDIESSTALLRQLGDGYSELLEGVRDIIRRTVMEAGGREIDARADEFFAVFERAEGAVTGAVTLQRTLREARWPGDVEVRVRVGIHTGRPTLTATGYVGLAVHTAARVCAIAHGGQVLVTEAAKSAVKPPLPAGVRFRDLGCYLLQGLPREQPLYQLQAAGLLDSFPSLRVTIKSPGRTTAEPVGRGEGVGSARGSRP
jgi:class 3 adenylate cyclase